MRSFDWVFVSVFEILLNAISVICHCMITTQIRLSSYLDFIGYDGFMSQDIVLQR